MENKKDLFANFSSARYADYQDTYQNPDVMKGKIEINHDPQHARNLDHFANGVK